VVNAGVGLTPAALVNGTTAWATQEPIVSVIALVLNAFLDWVKNKHFFREKDWTVPLMLILAAAISFVIWHLIFDDVKKAVENAFAIAANAHTNYRSALISGLGVFQPTKEENRYQPATDPTQAPNYYPGG